MAMSVADEDAEDGFIGKAENKVYTRVSQKEWWQFKKYKLSLQIVPNDLNAHYIYWLNEGISKNFQKTTHTFLNE